MSDAEETLQWLCWCYATSAERFYPPKESAKQCLEGFDVDSDFERGKHHGTHIRALNEADDFFRKLELCGFDPQAMAERECKTNQRLPEIDWSWYHALRGDDE